MKFVHIADVHFDMPFTSARYSKKIINQRRLDQRNIFYNTINYTKEINAEMLFISGDLFEHRYVEEDTINFIISCFKKIPDIPIFISPGNHDPLLPNSPYNTFNWPDNVTIFTNEIGMFEYNDIVIYGFGFNNYEIDTNQFDEIEIDNSKINILVTHGNLDGSSHQYNDIKSKKLKAFDYVALGHIHLPKVDNSRIIYPGSLVAGGFDEQGEHGLVVGEIDKSSCNVEFKKMDNREFKELSIELTEKDDEKSANEIVDGLNLGNDIYKITLTGVKIANVQHIIDILNDKENHICEIKDCTQLSYDLKKISEEKTLKGMFTKKILEVMEREKEREEEVNKAIELVYKIM